MTEQEFAFNPDHFAALGIKKAVITKPEKSMAQTINASQTVNASYGTNYSAPYYGVGTTTTINTNSLGSYQMNPSYGPGYPNPNVYPSVQPPAHSRNPIPNPPQKETLVEKIIGDGKNTSWTFDSPSQYPDVRVFDRTIEKDATTDEKTTTLNPRNDVEIAIVDGSIRVSFAAPPARKAVVVVIK